MGIVQVKVRFHGPSKSTGKVSSSFKFFTEFIKNFFQQINWQWILVITPTSVVSIPTRVCSKILMFGSLDVQKFIYLLLMLNFDAQRILNFIPFLCSQKRFFLCSEHTNIGLLNAHSCSLGNFDVRAHLENPRIFSSRSFNARKLMLNLTQCSEIWCLCIH